MAEKMNIHVIDGSPEEQNRVVREFFGLRPDQSFQDLDVDVEDNDDKAPQPAMNK